MEGQGREAGLTQGWGDSVKAAAVEGCLVGARPSEEMQLLLQLP